MRSGVLAYMVQLYDDIGEDGPEKGHERNWCPEGILKKNEKN